MITICVHCYFNGTGSIWDIQGQGIQWEFQCYQYDIVSLAIIVLYFVINTLLFRERHWEWFGISIANDI
mgnify:CR=1 FL=1